VILRRMLARWRSTGSIDGHRFERDARVVAAVDGDLTVLTNGAHYVTLNESGARIWDLLEHPRSLVEISAMMCAEYEAPADAIERDVEQLVAKLVRLRLISVHAN
jgi:hypothetical protein